MHEMQTRHARLKRPRGFTSSLGSSLFAFAISTLLLLPAPAHAVRASFGLSPDNNGDLLISTIRSARSELTVNIYKLESDTIADALIAEMNEGVDVEILIEHAPVPKISEQAEKVALRIIRAMKETGNSGNRFYIMTKHAHPTAGRRYRYNHAKYVIVDGREVLNSSENFKDTGHPVGGGKGTRGWDVVVESSSLARQLQRIFDEDKDTRYGDVIELVPSRGDTWPLPLRETSRKRFSDSQSGKAASARHTTPIGRGNVSSVELITSPDSLSPLLRMMRSARRTLDVEQMSLPSTWRDENWQKVLSPLVGAMIESARRGIEVRVLMNDDNAFLPYPSDEPGRNDLTAQLLEKTARCESLPLSARVVNVKRLGIEYLHNKGYIVDRERVLVSSINGTGNSVQNNREVALLLNGRDAGRYYGRAFDSDWHQTPAVNARKWNQDLLWMDCSPELGEWEKAPLMRFFTASWR